MSIKHDKPMATITSVGHLLRNYDSSLARRSWQPLEDVKLSFIIHTRIGDLLVIVIPIAQTDATSVQHQSGNMYVELFELVFGLLLFFFFF